MSQDTHNRENECLDNNQIIEANTVKNSDKNENKIKKDKLKFLKGSKIIASLVFKITSFSNCRRCKNYRRRFK